MLLLKHNAPKMVLPTCFELKQHR